ncbi:MAG: patatin-like phospholipase family protein [Candidatus Omnitrophica bacterium]|nr:patatin-like phospholipase family protein [Candidatus Omnitrophota bacterium]MCK5288164.1 patatin-like phospholipase family protein [Candidatus Omnitrophota bacterium]
MKFFKKEKYKIGLALGSGSARGLAHIGVLKALKENNITIDMIAGSSIGALIGAYFAKYQDIRGLEEITLNMEFKKLIRLADPNFFLLSKGFIRGKKVEEFLEIILEDIDFKDLKIPFFVVSTDIETGEEVIINTGSVVKAVRASISLPVVFTPVVFEDKFLIDGGVANPIPIDILRKKGMNYIIASNVSRKLKRYSKSNIKNNDFAGGVNPNFKKINDSLAGLINENKDLFNNSINFIKNLSGTNKKQINNERLELPSIFDVIASTIFIMEQQISQLKLKDADLIITPDVQDIALFEFYRAKEAIMEGYQKAMEIIRNKDFE